MPTIGFEEEEGILEAYDVHKDDEYQAELENEELTEEESQKDYATSIKHN